MTAEPAAVIVDAEVGRAASRVRATSSPPARPIDARATVGHRREQQRAVRDALVAGDAQPAAQRGAVPRSRARRGSLTIMRARPGDVVAVLDERVLERVEPSLGDDEHEHTAAALERVRDLEVGDVDAEARRRAW